MNPVVFEKSRITAVEHKLGNGGVSSRIKVAAVFTAKVAQALNAKWVLFDKEQLVKDGFKSVELDAEVKNIGIRFEVPKLGGALDLTSESATNFKVLRMGDGKKKAKKLMVQFRIQHAGSPFELLEHMIRVGGAEGTLTLTPLQKEMFEEAQKAGRITTSKPEPITFTERIAKAKTADEGREIIHEHDKAIHDLEAVHGLDPTVGESAKGYAYVGFSVLTAKERRVLIKAVSAVDKEAGARAQELVDDGLRMRTYFDTLVARENAACLGLGASRATPDAPEWRTAEEIAGGVPHHITQ